MKKYGMTSDEFFSKKNSNWSASEMATEKFQNDVIGTALNRTMRETASTNWSKFEGQTNIVFYAENSIDQQGDDPQILPAWYSIKEL